MEFYLFAVFICLYCLSLVDAEDFEQRCLRFKPDVVADSQLTGLEYLVAGASAAFPDNDPSCNPRTQKVRVNVCRISLFIKTSERSGISFELWLPEQWTGKRLLSTGNGGVDGCELVAPLPCLVVR